MAAKNEDRMSRYHEHPHLQSFHKQYDTDIAEIRIKGRSFHFYVPRSLDPFMDSQDPFHDFPLWSKIWEVSLALADALAGIAPEPGKRWIEIGCGLGVVGIVAASFGHSITMTEYDPHALDFSRANARFNQIPDMDVMILDWNKPSLPEGFFDYIVGSEVVYHERDYAPLRELFTRLLRRDGEVILAAGIRKTSLRFFYEMQQFFHIKAEKKILHTGEKDIQLLLCRMTFKNI